MSRIELTVNVDYLPNWGVPEGLRELCQNWLDAADDVHIEGAVSYREGTLRFRNPGASIERDALLFGTTSKVGRRDMRGQFGEGLKLGTLALVRRGLEVRIETPTEIWVAAVEESESLRVLKTRTRRPGKRPQDRVDGVEVIVRGVEREQYEAMRQRFLHFQKVQPERKKTLEYYGTVLIDPEFRGRVYCKGIHVTDCPKLKYGYDFIDGADTDRDRRMMNQWNINYNACRMLVQILDGEGMLSLIEEGYCDLETFADFGNRQQHERLAEAFRAKYGADAYPVASYGDSVQLSHYGKRGIVVPNAARFALEKVMESGTAAINRLGQGPKRVYSHGELTQPEALALIWAASTVEAALSGTALGGTKVLDRIRVVDFYEPTIQGLHRAPCTPGQIDISRKILSDRFWTLGVLVHELAHDFGGDGEKMHVAMIETMWMDMARVREGETPKGLEYETAQEAIEEKLATMAVDLGIIDVARPKLIVRTDAGRIDFDRVEFVAEIKPDDLTEIFGLVEAAQNNQEK